ncbi:hypothetical protein EBZ37_12050, partial [bacterium]|nr:hypothetical protein [bacterium]
MGFISLGCPKGAFSIRWFVLFLLSALPCAHAASPMLESLDPGARKILQECEVSKGSRYAEVLSSLSRVGGKEAAPAEACCVNPS